MEKLVLTIEYMVFVITQFNKENEMIKLCYWLRAIAALIAVGAMGSLQLDTIDWWTWFCQTMLGVVTWILVGYWIDDIKYYSNKKVR